jgi:hypothetical protein
MGILIRYYLRQEPDQDMDKMLEQYTAAIWIEERQAITLANAVNKGMSGK